MKDHGESEEDSEDGVDEDDDAELATEALDAEIFATLNAIRSKDPRVYNKDVTFYQAIEDEEDDGAVNGAKKDQPMTLKDYHTKNLLEGKFGGEDEDDTPVKTYDEEMQETKQKAIAEIQAAGDDDEDDDFLVAKSRTAPPSKERPRITEQDVENADKDPETFLSNFMSSRAWLPTDGSHWKPLESDDEEEEARAEEYESAYNMYFENPEGANEKLVTYARDAVASTTVRRDEKSARKKAREAARAKREAERREKEEDLARLRKLKVEEMEEKVKQIRKIGGFSGRDFKMEDWADVLEAEWSDDQWDEEMLKRFGDSYYDQPEDNVGSDDDDDDDVDDEDNDEDEADNKHKKKKPKKPKFDDDIDIKDLIPDFVDEEEEKPAFTLSDDDDDDDDAAEGGAEEDGEEGEAHRSSKTSKQRKQERADAKSAARRDRRLIESLIDSSLEYNAALATGSKGAGRFRYRETSPTNFGLTPRDILLASDTQLNEFAGLKKLATFRDPVKKKKDKKHLSKKARLRQWRLDTFGDEDGPKGGFDMLVGDEAGPANQNARKSDVFNGVDIREGDGTRKKKRNRKRKAGAVEA